MEKRELSQAQIDDSLELSFKFDSLVKLMSSKQEQLFQGVVHFHTSELARIGVKLDEAERKLAESPLIKGYVEQQKHLHKLKVCSVVSCVCMCSGVCVCVFRCACIGVLIVLVLVMYLCMCWVYFVEISA